MLGINSKIVRVLFDFFDKSEGVLSTRNEIVEYVTNTPKPFLYTYGLLYRNPATKYSPIDNTKAMDIIKNESYLKVTEHEDFYHLNAFGANDLW